MKRPLGESATDWRGRLSRHGMGVVGVTWRGISTVMPFVNQGLADTIRRHSPPRNTSHRHQNLRPRGDPQARPPRHPRL